MGSAFATAGATVDSIRVRIRICKCHFGSLWSHKPRAFHLGWNCAILHGGRSQDARESAIVDFKAGRKDILIASDVAARGLDVKASP